MLWLLALLLQAAPFLGTVVSARDPDGTWRCSSACHTTGNRDGGTCRQPVFAKGQKSKDACRIDLEDQCATKKPPPEGCR